MLKLVRKINTATGEVFSEKKEYYKDTLNDEGYKVPYHKAGAKMFDDVEYPKAMNDSEIGKMSRLAKYMIPLSNMLGYRARGSIQPYTEDHIINLVNLSPRRGKQFIKKMVSLGMMQMNIRKYGEVDCVEYYINPAHYFAGKRININLYLLFREYLDPIIPKWVKNEFLKTASAFNESAGETKK